MTVSINNLTFGDLLCHYCIYVTAIRVLKMLEHVTATVFVSAVSEYDTSSHYDKGVLILMIWLCILSVWN